MAASNPIVGLQSDLGWSASQGANGPLVRDICWMNANDGIVGNFPLQRTVLP